MPDRLTLVVGTTSDYIDMIRQRSPRRALFLTDTTERSRAAEPRPREAAEVLCHLQDYGETLAQLRKHLASWKIDLDGIVCFDCESMQLAAQLAEAFSLPYPSPGTVTKCRDKHASKEAWRSRGLPCPHAELVRNPREALSFLQRSNGTAILKPVAGSGSEYVFLCAGTSECRAAFSTIESSVSALGNNPDRPLYSRDRSWTETPHACVMEEVVQGEEYSCDFVLDGGRVDIVRMARKIPARDMPFGTTLAYVVPGALPAPMEIGSFRDQLKSAAQALGLERAICMLDFIVSDGRPVMIEMTPRPGGDCLVPLCLRSAGLDILGFALDFARGGSPRIPPPSEWRPLVGLRLLARTPGTIAELNSEALRKDKRVVEFRVKRRPGHRVVLPPEDYDSWGLGHIIFRPSGGNKVEEECAEITRLLEIEMEPPR